MAGQRQVLIVGALYPPPNGPTGAAGVRARAMARALTAAGHRVRVVCARSAGNVRDCEDGIDVVPAPWIDVEARARRVGIDIREVETRRESGGPPRAALMREIFVRVAIPDRYVVWVPAAIFVAARAGRDCDVMISTGPVSAHLVARAVCGDRPWIADFNDLWALDPHRTNGSLRDAGDVILEVKTIRPTVHLTTANEVYRDELSRRHRKPVTTLYGGFDERDFPDVPSRRNSGPLELLCVGTLYADQDLSGLLRTLAAGRHAGWLADGSLIVRFIGRLTERAALEAARHGVGHFVAANEPVARGELIERMMSADALLLFDHDLEPNALPMRLFEYIGAGRPIIVLGAKDHLIAKLVAENELGLVVNQTGELESLIRTMISGRQPLPAPNPLARERFTARSTMRTLVSLVEDVQRRG